MKILYIDIGRCSECKGCIEIAPDLFRYNEITGFMEAVDLEQYDEKLVMEAIKNCPKKCIHFEEYTPSQKKADTAHPDRESVK